MHPDFLVVGAGVVGLTTALELKRRYPDQCVRVIDKEPAVGLHASGRNSGVLHAGFYYSADSLKARFSKQGCAELAVFCEERGLPLLRCGKLVVARTEAEHTGLDELLRRARVNGVDLQPIDADEARRIEPRVRTAGRALWSPTTGSVEPAAVMRALLDEVLSIDVDVRLATPWDHQPCGTLINAAGLYADRISRRFGYGEHVRILPFKGLYLYGDEAPLACHVYPVPDLRFPFLGVHFTVTPSGGLKIGPTALPALWRENYGGLRGFSGRELAEVLAREARMFLTDPTFRRLARRELPKAGRRHLVGLAGSLVEGLDPVRWTRWGRPGIRAQLLDLRTDTLVTDFVVEGDRRSLHVLNAVSPAFTCSLPFARYLVDRLEGAVQTPSSGQDPQISD